MPTPKYSCNSRFTPHTGIIEVPTRESHHEAAFFAAPNGELDISAREGSAAGKSAGTQSSGAVGCTSGNYASSLYIQGGRPGGVNGWGDMNCNIDGWNTSNTGWSNFVHLESAGRHLHGDSTGRNNGCGSTNPVHPVCATPP